MPSHSPETPRQIEETTRLKPEEWLGPRNTRTLIHIYRNSMLDVVREALGRKEPLLATMGGFCLFKTFTDDSEFSILITNNSQICGDRNTVVSVNKLRQPTYDEPVFPNGRVLELTDLTIPDQTKWLKATGETIYRGQHEHTWGVPSFTTLLYRRNETLELYGNLVNNFFVPQPASNMQEVGEFAESLWSVQSALALCTEMNLCEDITSISFQP